MRRALACMALAACGPSVSDFPDAPTGGGAADAAGPGAADAGLPADAPPPPFFGAVYAHSPSDLYWIDPDTLGVGHVGTFTFDGTPGVDVITDIALDADANMVGISYEKVYAIDKDTAACTYLADLGFFFNALSFVPAEEIDPTSDEILVGANGAGQVYRIDPMTGASTQIGNYGGGLKASGDIVSVSGFGTVATVRYDEEGLDYLARLDMSAGGTATIIGPTGQGNVYGLGFWKGKVFGFTELKRFLLLDVDSGASDVIQEGNVYWWGAGVTTSAPIIP